MHKLWFVVLVLSLFIFACTSTNVNRGFDKTSKQIWGSEKGAYIFEPYIPTKK